MPVTWRKMPISSGEKLPASLLSRSFRSSWPQLTQCPESRHARPGGARDEGFRKPDTNPCSRCVCSGESCCSRLSCCSTCWRRSGASCDSARSRSSGDICKNRSTAGAGSGTIFCGCAFCCFSPVVRLLLTQFLLPNDVLLGRPGLGRRGDRWPEPPLATTLVSRNRMSICISDGDQQIQIVHGLRHLFDLRFTRLLDRIRSSREHSRNSTSAATAAAAATGAMGGHSQRRHTTTGDALLPLLCARTGGRRIPK